ncbi:MAG: hypothetical protein ACR2RE_03815 [Geminicoccaceae bacterium]
MRQQLLMISGVTAAERYQATTDVNDAISAAGGWVVDHTSFSNVAITIRFSLPSQRLDELRDRVIAARIKLDDDSLTRIRTMGEQHLLEPKDLTATLNITFIHDEPDLRREIPAVPG